MRALFIVWNYPSEAHPAAAVFHRTAAEALERSGLTMDVVVPHTWWPPGLEHLSPKSSEPRDVVKNGVRIRRPRYLRLPKPMYSATAPSLMASAILRVLPERPDVVHSHFAFPFGLVGLKIARRLNVPAVLTLHGSDVNRFLQLSTLMRRGSTVAIRESDYVIAVSESLSARTKELTGTTPDVVPIGIDLRPYENLPDRAVARKELGLPDDATVALYVGTLFPEKGIREFVAAIESFEVDGILGVLVGHGPLRNEFDSASKCRFVGPEPNERIPLYLSAADVFILPSYSEGMPTVLVEAGAAGVPVIATSVGGIPELLGDDRGVLIEPRSQASLSAGLQDVLSSLSRSAERAARLRDYVLNAYDADNNAAFLARKYASLVQSG
jgi:teichuronic acid biosynthesis glycosyltransferase TuaC